jgi:hypothetical protein
MKYYFTFILITLLCITAAAQEKGSVYFSPLYQDWSIGSNYSFYELTNLLSLNYSQWRNTNFNLVTRYSSVGGNAGNLRGFSDTQIAFNYKIPSYNLLIDAGISIPTGKTELTLDEYETSLLISQSVFALQTPGFGQGMNVFLGASYLISATKDVALGAGLSYQYRSEYRPLKDIEADYTPSDEITATAGIDIRLDKVSSLTGDLTGIFYGSDKLNDKKVFSAGRRILANVMYRRYFRFDVLTVTAAYRNGALDKLEGLPSPAENDKVNPDRFSLNAGYRQHVSSLLNLGYNIFFISFEETVLYYSGYNFFGAAFTPEFKLSPSVKIPLRIKYMSGSAEDKPSLNNFDIGAGIIYIM